MALQLGSGPTWKQNHRLLTRRSDAHARCPRFYLRKFKPMPLYGSRMITTARKAPLRNGLRDISMDDFWKDPLVVADTLHEKLNALPINPAKHPKLAQQVNRLIELLRALGRRRYGRISLLAATDFFQSAHYF